MNIETMKIYYFAVFIDNQKQVYNSLFPENFQDWHQDIYFDFKKNMDNIPVKLKKSNIKMTGYVAATSYIEAINILEKQDINTIEIETLE
ncbi:MAG: hypothetical protein DA328_04455 [Nitrososphaeraceae archaeon]|nr:hypothetical protein [Nitrososphaeraceae archaeon]